MFVEKTFVPSWTWRSCRNGWTLNPISWKITCLCDPLFYWYQRTCLNLFESRLLYWPNRYLFARVLKKSHCYSIGLFWFHEFFFLIFQGIYGKTSLKMGLGKFYKIISSLWIDCWSKPMRHLCILTPEHRNYLKISKMLWLKGMPSTTQCSKIGKKCNFKSTNTHFSQFQKWQKNQFLH